MSCRTRRVALAVNAAIGWLGKSSLSRFNCRYSGRKSCPHSEMQCASSMAKKETGTRLSQSEVPLRAMRSGETYSNRYAPSHARFRIWLRSSLDRELLRNPAGIPIWSSCATWSCIRAIRGDTTTAVFFSSSTAGIW